MARKDASGEGASLNKWIGVGVGAGIGSAAIAAALLYANHVRKPKPPRGPKEE